MAYSFTLLSDRYDLLDEMNRIGGAAWPEFMLHDPVALNHWMEMVDVFRQYQLMILQEAEILAIVNTVPFEFSGNLDTLPDEGVDWGVKKAISDYRAGIKPNLLLGVQVVVAQQHFGKGLSTVATEQMLRLAEDNDLDAVVVPLRPSNKHEHPHVAMDEYLHWKNEAGLPFDNWLRVHQRMGGEILGVCPKSMLIPGTVQEWETWTGQSFPESGEYLVPGALNPVLIDLETDSGTYVEPNIWIAHNLSDA